ncbi:hypothetical protein U8D42_17255 [Mycobacterium europaeum]|uniref:hypothetical protein n=1 Tax=Mycobacterium europaeum TaxID=761804 RepID=UPI002ADF6C42|nr:hypothetical protein [Mycobacterium europaeum]MEA1159785.1 hypothetical protein [Mycobacterium europaeum]
MSDFEAWWENYGQPYEAAVIEQGGTPWTASIEERQKLWARRYERPAPPIGLTNDLDAIRGTARSGEPVASAICDGLAGAA